MNHSETIIQIKGGRTSVGEYFNLQRKVLIVTDEGVPKEYAHGVLEQCKDGTIYAVKAGEESKSFETLQEILQLLLDKHFTREDVVIAVGGGVVGDLTGLAASLYARGIDWYNVPTTVLSQVDASVGGKTAINLGGYKNMVGTFYQPEGVLIDSEVLNTLPKRQIVNGLIEALKMGMIMDEELVELLEGLGSSGEELLIDVDQVIGKAIGLKEKIVRDDEKEKGLRRILNYGHTIGHGFESAFEGRLLHGEAVACGMLAIAEGDVRERIREIFKKWGLWTFLQEQMGELDAERKNAIKEAIAHDKKMGENYCRVVVVEAIGSCKVEVRTLEEIWKKVDDFCL